MQWPANDLQCIPSVEWGFCSRSWKFPFFWGSTTISADDHLISVLSLVVRVFLWFLSKFLIIYPTWLNPLLRHAILFCQKRPRLSCPQEFLQFTAMFPQQPAGFKPALLVHGRSLDEMNVIRKGAMTMDKKRNTQAILDQLDIFF